jgi:hypothetical protein
MLLSKRSKWQSSFFFLHHTITVFGRWVSGKYKDLPSILKANPDWYWLARSDTEADKSGQYLLVKEKYADSDVLCPLADWNSNTPSVGNLDPDYQLYQVTPTSPNYVVLGLYYLNSSEALDKDLGLGKTVYKKLRAVRGDLVIDGVYADTYDMVSGTKF